MLERHDYVRSCLSLARPGSEIATLQLDASYRARVVSGRSAGCMPGERHFELLSTFASGDQLRRAVRLAAQHGLSGHELGAAA